MTYYIGNMPCGDSLQHHGIKGQKHGVRRFQNLDGSWTAAGRERYSEAVKKRDSNMSLSPSNSQSSKKPDGKSLAPTADQLKKASTWNPKYEGPNSKKMAESSGNSAASSKAGDISSEKEAAKAETPSEVKKTNEETKAEEKKAKETEKELVTLLKNGSKGDDVAKMQQKLVSLGFNLDKYGVDGKFGSETQAALKAFQKKMGISDDGIFGKDSSANLERAIAIKQMLDENATERKKKTSATTSSSPKTTSKSSASSSKKTTKISTSSTKKSKKSSTGSAASKNTDFTSNYTVSSVKHYYGGNMGMYYIGNMPCGDSLQHHGIKGQKWGVRRFQNDDGSLTPAGKERYGRSEGYSDTKMRKLLTGDFALGSRRRREKTAEKFRVYGDMSSSPDMKKAYRNAEKSQRRLNNEIDLYNRHTSTGKLLAQNLVFGPIGGGNAYRAARAMGTGRGKAAVQAMLAGTLTAAGGGVTAGLTYGASKLWQGHDAKKRYGDYSMT